MEAGVGFAALAFSRSTPVLALAGLVLLGAGGALVVAAVQLLRGVAAFLAGPLLLHVATTLGGRRAAAGARGASAVPAGAGAGAGAPGGVTSADAALARLGGLDVQQVATLVVDLQRRVPDGEAVVQHALQRAADVVAVVLGADEDVRGQRREP